MIFTTMDNASLLFGACFVFAWISYLWETYLWFRQYKTYLNTVVPPVELKEIWDAERFKKSRLYKIDKTLFQFFSDAVQQVLVTFVLLFEAIPGAWKLSGSICSLVGLEGEIKQSLVFTIIGMFFSEVIALPISYLNTFVVEARHGFNKQTINFFLKDRVKKFAVSLVIFLPVTALLLWIMKITGDYFVIYVMIFLTLFSLFIMTIYPEFIAPLFDKYTPLPEGELKTAIEDLAREVGYPLKKIYVVEGSKRSSHSNAYLYGIWNNKRIVLYDTLLADYGKSEADSKQDDPALKVEKTGLNNKEVVAVVGHELGHWKLWHNAINFALTEMFMLCQFSIFAVLYKNPIIYSAFGLHDEMPIMIGLTLVFMFIYAPLNTMLNVLCVCMTRRMEYAADRFSSKMGLATMMKGALVKLSLDNLMFPVDDWLYSAWHYSHPSIPERLDAISKKE